jgi:hypothetical protein
VLTKFWLENLKEGVYSEDLNIDEKIILKWILEKQSYMAWIRFIWLRALVLAVLNFCVLQVFRLVALHGL